MSIDYSSSAGPPTLDTATPSPGVREPHSGLADTNPQLVISAERKRVLLGQPGTPSTDIVVRHTVQFVIRILRAWPRVLASYTATDQLPPMIHKAQLAESMPGPLANCCTLVRMWADHSEHGSRTLVKVTILEEVRRLLREVSNNSIFLPKAGSTILALLTLPHFSIISSATTALIKDISVPFVL